MRVQDIDDTVIGFLSYTRRDNKYNANIITSLREKLEHELSCRKGTDVRVFQDTEDIRWGKQFNEVIVQKLKTTPFLIPILTPSYFQSGSCIEELKSFLQFERENGNDDRILSIKFIEYNDSLDSLDMEVQELVKEIQKRNYIDLTQIQQTHLIERPHIVNIANELHVQYLITTEANNSIKSKTEENEIILPAVENIKKGEFVMGSKDFDHNEQPTLSVTIGQDFSIGKYPVNFNEWDSFERYCIREPSFFNEVCKLFLDKKSIDKTEFSLTIASLKVHDEFWGRNSFPLINVSWFLAQAYLLGISLYSGKNYRLPSEAEWEYCCKKGRTEKAFLQNLSTNGNRGNIGWDIGRTTPENGEPNELNLYHMLGQVWEWVEDDYCDNLENTSTNGKPYVSKKNDLKVVKGGSWKSDPKNVRSTIRRTHLPSHRLNNVGFRVLLES